MIYRGRRWLLHIMGLQKRTEQHLATISMSHRLKVVTSAFLALFLVAYISQYFLNGSSHMLLLASMGASAVLLFGLPGSPLAKPMVFIWGHLLPASIGLACSHLITDFAFMAALTIALVIFVMYLFETMHPPGGATALVPVIAATTGPAPELDFLLFPVGLNILVMLTVSLFLQKIVLQRQSVSPGPGMPGTADVPPLSRSLLKSEDLKVAINQFQAVLDISETDLLRLFNLAQQHAVFRQQSTLCCADIMAKDLVTVKAETSLQTAWSLLRRHKISMLPVVDDDYRLIGVISVPDFLKDLALPEFTGIRQHLHSLWLHLRLKLAASRQASCHIVGHKMSIRLVVAAPTDPITNLLPLLANNGLHHVPIVAADQRLCGIVTQSDLMAALVQTTNPQGIQPITKPTTHL